MREGSAREAGRGRGATLTGEKPEAWGGEAAGVEGGRHGRGETPAPLGGEAAWVERESEGDERPWHGRGHGRASGVGGVQPAGGIRRTGGGGRLQEAERDLRCGTRPDGGIQIAGGGNGFQVRPEGSGPNGDGGGASEQA